MTAQIRIGSTFADLLAYASEHEITDLVVDNPFVSALSALQPDTHSDAFMALVEILVDMFHDHFDMNSRQRKQVTKELLENKKSLREIFATYESGYDVEAGPYLPGRVQGGCCWPRGPIPCEGDDTICAIRARTLC